LWLAIVLNSLSFNELTFAVAASIILLTVVSTAILDYFCRVAMRAFVGVHKPRLLFIAIFPIYPSLLLVHYPNFLYLCDNQGVLIAISDPISGQHHDLSDIKTHFEQLLTWLSLADIRYDGLFLNADAGFDSQEFRTICHGKKIEPNIDFNPRNNAIGDRFEYFDCLLYRNRYVIERAFAWLDAFKALLIRYETSAINWLSINVLGMIACFIRKIHSHKIKW
jgi:hypothetical protein